MTGTETAETNIHVRFTRKNLAEASPAQVAADLLRIREAISEGRVRPLRFGDYSLKKTA